MEITLCSATYSHDEKIEPPIGPLYIASSLEAIGVKVNFKDYQLCKNKNLFSGKTLADFLFGHSNVVAISCFIDMLPVVIDATKILFKRRPKTQFILGGPGPTENAKELLRVYPWLTCIVRSEGEETIIEWVKRSGENFTEKIDGLSYRRGKKIIVGKKRKRIQNLDSLPLPAYHLIDFKEYKNARIITTRGCFYRCSFCDVSALWGNESVYRNINLVVEEIEHLREKYGITLFGVGDDTFLLNRNRVETFCREIKNRNLDIKWGCFGRINLMNENIIKHMAESGCRAIFYGVDSGSQRILDETNKMVKIEEISEIVKLSTQYFDQVEASFIWGYPSETIQDFNMTIDRAAILSDFVPKVNIQLHKLSPLPSTPIYKSFKGDLIEPHPSDKEWMLLPDIFFKKRNNRIKKIVQNNRHLYSGFYSFPTPEVEKKRKLLSLVLKELHHTIGLTLVDTEIERLIKVSDVDIEKKLLKNTQNSYEKIGVGLALNFFNRLRNHNSKSN